ncbi:E3 ubiquitin-protein ligase TRAF7-like isoform X2 [Acanthaster planci]|uniref:E3 ubiquitin-protein ligase TRAF7-like isoform X2 n=1 Tax=Acanthaster planci TaxID=133434 RepID=A0A8B7ZZG0_ACAPL|nr:E3 ubiquitin-protein ligase TRAF7-like isoform X2 [Acanthaster planci]
MATSVFAEEPSVHLFCPSCKRLLQDPVISVVCGHTFCRHCLTDGKDSVILDACPVDEKPLKNTSVVANRAITSQLDDILVYCKNGIKRFSSRNDELITDTCGCPELIRLSQKAEHEASCPYSSLQCPNSPECGTLLRLDLEEHVVTVCPFVKCHHYEKGCTFTGTSRAVEDHCLSCKYEASPCAVVNTVSQPSEDQVLLQKQVQMLIEKVLFLENSRDEMKAQLEACTRALTDVESKYNDLKATMDKHDAKLSSSSFSRSQRPHIRPRTASDRRDSSSPENTMTGHDHWQVPFEFKCIGTLRGHNAAIHCLATRGHRLYSSGLDKVIKVWDVDALSKGCVQNIKGHTDTVNALLAGSEYLYSAGEDQSIRMWKYDTMKEHKCVKKAHDSAICALVKNSKYLFSSGYCTIKVWHADTLEAVQSISGLHHWVRALTLEPSKEALYSGSHNVVCIWDATGQFNLKRKLEHQYGSVYALAITPKFIIVGTYNRNMQLFDVVTHQHVKCLGGHIGIVTDLATSPAGKFVISSSYDNTVQIWDLQNFLSLQVLSRHQGSVNAIALCHSLLFTASEDKEIKIFKYFRLITYSSFGNHILPGKDM